MEPLSRVTVSLPAALLKALDEKLTREGENRSAALRRLLEEMLHNIEEQEQIARYVEGYRGQPQTEGEFGWSDAVAQQHLAEVEWR